MNYESLTKHLRLISILRGDFYWARYKYDAECLLHHEFKTHTYKCKAYQYYRFLEDIIESLM